MDKKLIVNADDFGLTAPITRGIINAIENGIVTSVSLAANGDDFDHACDYLAAHPDISVGWHVNLTSGHPVAHLNDTTGLFYGKNALIRAVLLGRVATRSIQEELTAQWLKLQRTGLAFSHIDSHHDVHIWPRLRRLMLPLVISHGIPFVRFTGCRMYPHTAGGSVWRQFGHTMTAAIVNRLSQPSSATHDVDFIQFRELYQLDNKQKAVYSYIEQIVSGTSLMVCHPGLVDVDNRLQLHYNKERELELAALSKPELRECLAQRRVKLVSYWDLLDEDASQR